MPDQSQPTKGTFPELLCALSFATSLGFGGHIEHGLGTASLGLYLADALNLAHEEREALFYSALLKDVGCTACSVLLDAFLPDEKAVMLSDVILMDPSKIGEMIGWLSRYLRPDAHLPQRLSKLLSFLAHCGPLVREFMRSHCEVAELFAQQLGFPDSVQRTLRFQWERWDGSGMAYGLKAEDIPRPARLLHLAQVLELTYQFGGPETAYIVAREKRGTRFDPEGVDAFLKLSSQANFWHTFEQETTQKALLARCPATRGNEITVDRVEQVCEALANFIDFKTREGWHHSSTVAAVAVDMGICLGWGANELTKLRCAALVHDIGKVALPVTLLDRKKSRSESEEEIYRLHTYYTQLILERVEALHDLMPAAATHHEWINGQGYHRQLSREQIPVHGRILAVANAYAEHLQHREHRDPAEILRTMHPKVGRQFDGMCYEALVTAVTGKSGELVSRRLPRESNLTVRESEVLRLLTQGHNTPQIAQRLAISKKTVEHHLAHIYAKIGVTSRTAAVVYAVQQELV